MSSPLKHPTVEAVLAIHEEVLDVHGGSAGLRSRELLKPAVAAPRAAMIGVLKISDPIEVAAAYHCYVCSNDAFVDGNKRVAQATCLVFLSEHDRLKEEELNRTAWENLTLAVAAGALRRDEVTAILQKLVE